MAKAGKLTPKQGRFVEEYLVDLNATQAAIRAGYSEKTAAVVGYENLRKPHVAAAVEKAVSERSDRTKVTSDTVVEELAKIGFSDMRRFSSWGPDGVNIISSESLEDEHAACVSEVSSQKTVTTDKYGATTQVVNSKMKLYDKLGALNSLGKHLNMFVERKEVTGRDGGPIEQEVRGGFDLAEDIRRIDEEIAEAERLENEERAREGEIEEEGEV